MKSKSHSMQSSEAQTRKKLIDPLLKKAGWDPADRQRVQIELPVDGYDAAPWNGVTDYCLRAEDGGVIAVVEAKKCSRSARDGEAQLRKYVQDIAKRQEYAPFGFMTNGRDIGFWEVDQEVPRQVAGFFTPTDLARMLFIRLRRTPLESRPINRPEDSDVMNFRNFANTLTRMFGKFITSPRVLRDEIRGEKRRTG